jgi:hypothetical protein
LVAVVDFAINFYKAMEEGANVWDAAIQAGNETWDDAVSLIKDATKSIDGLSEAYKENVRLEFLKKEVKRLGEAVKLTNGLIATNNNLLQAQKAVTSSAEEAGKIQAKINSNKRSAIFQELGLLRKTAELNTKLTSEELIRKQDLNNQLAILRIEESQADKDAQDARFEAKKKIIDEELALRTATLTASITDADQLNKEIIEIEAEALQKRVELNKEFGKELTQEAKLTALELQNIQNQGNQAQADEDQRAIDERIAREQEALTKQEQLFQSSLQAQNSAVAEQQRDLRQLRNDGLVTEEQFAEKSLDIQKQKLAEEIKLRQEFGKETFALESQLLDLEQQRADQELETQKERNTQALEQFQEVATAIADIAFQLQEAQIAKVDQLINDSQGRIDELQTTIDATKNQRDELDEQIKSSEDNARNARGTNAEEIKEQLDAQRLQRVALLKLEAKQAKERQRAEEEQKQLEQDKADREKKLAKQRANIAIATAIVQTAPAIANALTAPFPLSVLAVATTLATLGSAIATAKSASTKLRKGGVVNGASHENGGVRGTGAFGDIEVEGKEFVINREATANNIGLIESINKYGATKKFADGGLIPSSSATETAQGDSEVKDISKAVLALSNRPMVVGVTDITDGMNRVKAIDDSSQIG